MVTNQICNWKYTTRLLLLADVLLTSICVRLDILQHRTQLIHIFLLYYYINYYYYYYYYYYYKSLWWLYNSHFAAMCMHLPDMSVTCQHKSTTVELLFLLLLYKSSIRRNFPFPLPFSDQALWKNIVNSVENNPQNRKKIKKTYAKCSFSWVGQKYICEISKC